MAYTRSAGMYIGGTTKKQAGSYVSPVVPTKGGMTLGDKTFAELGLKVKETYERPGPTTRDRTMEIAGRPGLWDFGADVAETNFIIPCRLLSQDRPSLQQAIRAVMAHLFDASGKPKTMPLVFDDEPDVSYNVRYSGRFPISRVIGIGDFSISLTAYDPHAYLNESTENINWGSSLTFRDDINFDDQWSFPISGPTNIIVNNFGATNAEPVTEITGSFSSLALASDISGFNYSEAISNQTLVIDHGGFTAKIGETNKMSVCSSSFLEIPPGRSNVYIGGENLNCTITFKFRPRWQ